MLKMSEVMNDKICFRDIDIRDKELWNKYLFSSGIRFCDFSFLNICAWKFYYHTEISEYNGFLLVRHYFNNDYHYFYPIGRGDLKSVLDDLKVFANHNHNSFLLDCLTWEHFEEFRTIFHEPFKFRLERNYSDYLYLRNDWIELKGKRLQAKRNHLKRFFQYYKYEYKHYTLSFFDDCISLTEKWIKENSDLNLSSLKSELKVIRFALTHLEELGGYGGTLWIDGKLVAYSFGSPVDENTFIVHVEKADTAFEGIYVAMGNLFAQNLPSRYRFLNREDDMGLKGLRQSKLSYYPHELLAKFCVEVPLKKFDNEASLKALWNSVFHDNLSYIDRFYSVLEGEFDLICREDEKQNLLSSMYVLKYEFQLGKDRVPISYFYAVATESSFRNTGVATAMIYEALWRGFLQKSGMVFLTPANSDLIDFYSNFGFAAWLYKSGHSFSFKDIDVGESQLDLSICDDDITIQLLLNKLLRCSEATILPSDKCLDFWIEDMRNEGKEFCFIYRDNELVASVLTEVCGGDLSVCVLSDQVSIPISDLLFSLQKLYSSVSKVEIQNISFRGEIPYSLCRIVHLSAFLDLYVRYYNGDSFSFYYHDELLPLNSGYYMVEVGKWTKHEFLEGNIKSLNSLSIQAFLFREKMSHLGQITYCAVLE